jgi:hypothetical protein
MDINKEAEEYVKEWCLINSYNERDMIHSHSLPKYETTISLLTKGFRAGHNSKATQAEKLKFAIEAVLQFRKATFGLGNSGLEQLQQQLKELEELEDN